MMQSLNVAINSIPLICNLPMTTRSRAILLNCHKLYAASSIYPSSTHPLLLFLFTSVVALLYVYNLISNDNKHCIIYVSM